MNWRVRADSPLSLSAASIWIRSETWADVRLARPSATVMASSSSSPRKASASMKGFPAAPTASSTSAVSGAAPSTSLITAIWACWVERPQHDHGGSFVFEQIEELFRDARVR